MQLNVLTTASLMAMKREMPLSDFIPYSHIKDAQTFVTKNGAIGSVIHVRGLAFEVSDDDELNANYQRLTRWVQSLSPSMAIYMTWHRHQQHAYPMGDFEKGFAHDFNEAYKKKFEHQKLYTNDLYITLIAKGPSESGFKTVRWFKKFYHAANDEAFHHFQAKQHEALSQSLQEAMQALSSFSPRILGEVQRAKGVASELLGFLGLCVNGTATPLAYPLMDLCQYLPQRRVSTHHQTIEFSGVSESDAGFGALLSIKQYGHETCANNIRAFLGADFEFISTHSFCREDNLVVIDKMKRQSKHYKELDAQGSSLIDSLETAIDGIRSEYVSFGWHHHSLLVLSDTVKHLQESVSKAVNIYRQSELVVVRESLNLEAGFFAQMPANFSHIKRRALISNENLIDFSPLHNYHHGYQNENHLGSSLMLVESQGRTPLNLNLHERGDKNDPSLGHTIIIAPPGSGKTTLLCALDAMSKKYKGRSIFFDRNRGCEIYVRANGGFYTTISPDKATGFNPLQLDDTPLNRSFLTNWLAAMISPKETLSQSVISQLDDLVARNYSLPKASRRLSTIIAFLPIDFAYRDHFTPWLRSHTSDKSDGSLAYLFDNPIDTLNFSQIRDAGFDMTHLLSEEQKPFAGPVLMYLFHRSKELMTGELVGVYLDEGWNILDNPYFAQEMIAAILTWRKINVYIVFIAQLLSSILKSTLAMHLTEGMATQIFLSNPKAKKRYYMKGAGLSNAEYEFIKTTDKKARRFLFKQGTDAAIARMNLEGLDRFTRVFSGNTKNVAVCEALREKVGNDPTQWLPLFYQHFERTSCD